MPGGGGVSLPPSATSRRGHFDAPPYHKANKKQKVFSTLFPLGFALRAPPALAPPLVHLIRMLNRPVNLPQKILPSRKFLRRKPRRPIRRQSFRLNFLPRLPRRNLSTHLLNLRIQNRQIQSQLALIRRL